MNILIVFGVTLVVFLLVVVGMAVGVLMGRRQISGSCGGLANQTDADGQTSCSLCSDPDAACRELGQRMKAAVGAEECVEDCQQMGCSSEQQMACKSH